MTKVGIAVLIGLGCFLMGSLLGPAWAQTGDLIPYNQFENDVKSKVYTAAAVDGNIFTLTTSDGKTLRAEAPEVGRAVGLLIKFEVPVRAYRPIPASGITWPVLFALLIPYGVLAFYAFALAGAATVAGAGAGLPEVDDNLSEAEPATNNEQED